VSVISAAKFSNGPSIVVNWHVTEACNYGCKFCYSHWTRPETSELWRDTEATAVLITALRTFLRPDNPLWQDRFTGRPRLNFAGGEPTLWQAHLAAAVDQAAEAGFDVSLISNGSRPDALRAIAPQLCLLGLSIDSTQPEGNAQIGRADRKGAQIATADFVRLVRDLRAINPALQVKLNTVVNAINVEENFAPLIKELAPERWKILRMLPSYTDALEIDGTAFDRFVARHRSLGPELSIEDNCQMVQSYLMIDPHGRFYQNRLGGKGYDYSSPILEVGAAQAFTQIPFDLDRFLDRY